MAAHAVEEPHCDQPGALVRKRESTARIKRMAKPVASHVGAVDISAASDRQPPGADRARDVRQCRRVEEAAQRLSNSADSAHGTRAFRLTPRHRTNARRGCRNA